MEQNFDEQKLIKKGANFKLMPGSPCFILVLEDAVENDSCMDGIEVSLC